MRRIHSKPNLVGQRPRPKTQGSKNWNWKGGSRVYYSKQARRAWEKYYNIEIPFGYDIHHIDRNYKNNNPDNLIMVTKEEHRYIHAHLTRHRKYKPFVIFLLLAIGGDEEK